MAGPNPLPPAQSLMRLVGGYRISRCIHAAAVLGLADLLKDGPRTAADLAQATGTHARSLYRMLRGLASVGVFAEDDQGRFGLTPLAEVLRSDVPGSVRAAAIMSGDEHYRAWSEFLYCLRTGQIGFDRVYGKPIFDYLPEHPESARIFDEAMVSVHGPETAAMLDAYHFGGFGTIVDVGGGNGSVLRAMLQRYPNLRGILFDRPDVVAGAAVNLREAGLAERCQTVGGNFFEEVPAGGDAYFMRHIIHDWDDERSRTILKNVRRVIPPAGRLLLGEWLIAPGSEGMFGKWMDLHMLVVTGGMERTEAEYQKLYAATGFELVRVVRTASEVSVIEAVPV